MGFSSNVATYEDVASMSSRILTHPDVVSLAPAEREKLIKDLIRQNAVSSVLDISAELAKAAMEPDRTVPQRISILETQIKLAGLDKRADEKPQANGYKLVINLGSTTEQFRGLTIEQSPDSDED